MLFEELLARYYTRDQLEGFFSILSTAPKVTTLRVNTLKYTAPEAKSLLEDHFSDQKAPFQVQISTEFPDLLFIPSIPSSLVITPSEKGTLHNTGFRCLLNF